MAKSEQLINQLAASSRFTESEIKAYMLANNVSRALAVQGLTRQRQHSVGKIWRRASHDGSHARIDGAVRKALGRK